MPASTQHYPLDFWAYLRLFRSHEPYYLARPLACIFGELKSEGVFVCFLMLNWNLPFNNCPRISLPFPKNSQNEYDSPLIQQVFSHASALHYYNEVPKVMYRKRGLFSLEIESWKLTQFMASLREDFLLGYITSWQMAPQWQEPLVRLWPACGSRSQSCWTLSRFRFSSVPSPLNTTRLGTSLWLLCHGW